MKPVNTYRVTIYPWNCDHMGYMNVQFYVGKFYESTWTLLTELGLTPAYLKDNNRGKVALEQHMFSLENKNLVSKTEITGLHIDVEFRKGVLFPLFVKEKLYELKLRRMKNCYVSLFRCISQCCNT